MRRSSIALAVLLLVLAGACSTDDGPDETTTGAPITDAPTSSTDEATSQVDGTDGLDHLPGVQLLVTFAIDGGRVTMQGTVVNDSPDDVAVLPLDATQGNGSRLTALRGATVDGDDAPPQVDAVFVAAGTSVTMTEELGTPANAPTGEVTVCLEGDVVAGGPAPTGDDPPTVRIGTRGDGAGVVCSDPTPTGR